MLQINKHILSLIILISCVLSHAHQIEKKSIFASRALGDISLHHSDVEGFSVMNDLGTSHIPRWNMDKELRGISNHKLAKMLAAGAYLEVNQDVTKEQYGLRLKGRLNGG